MIFGIYGYGLRGSVRLGTPFNDIRPRNIGANGIIFDPATAPFHQTLFAILTGLVGGLTINIPVFFNGVL